MLSSKATEFRFSLENKNTFFDHCDGGDPGTPKSPSIWLFGLEPGWSKTDAKAEQLTTDCKEDLDYSVEAQLGWPFNRNAFKLLAALAGMSSDKYRAFALERRPFERGSIGYFKGNIFPVPQNNISVWDSDAIDGTGFESKIEYQDWVREKRFPIVSSWIAECRPRIFIGVGNSYKNDFIKVTQSTDVEPIEFFINGHRKIVYWSSQGIVPLVIIPHLSSGKNGLNSYAAIDKTAEIILERIG